MSLLFKSLFYKQSLPKFSYYGDDCWYKVKHGGGEVKLVGAFFDPKLWQYCYWADVNSTLVIIIEDMLEEINNNNK